jgi:hypothetical protein
MNKKILWRREGLRPLVAVICSVLLVYQYSWSAARPQQPPPQEAASAPAEPAAKIPPDQLDSLVAPIALYPDPMLAQVLAAATYPLELIQLQQWLLKNKDLKDKALADAVAKQPWDPSVQSMAGLPDVVKRLADDIQWTTDLGNAFLAQQSDVMDAVQRMRKKAQDKGNLKSNEQQKVETKVVESKQVIVVEQANPQVVYVPSYNPTVVYGPPPYPYPPVYYPPPPPPGYYAASMAISFGVGVAMGAMWGGGWGYGCGWGSSNVNINVDNNFNRNTNINGGNRTNNIQGGNRVNNQPTRGGGNRGGGSSWQHNPQHRGGTPYGNRDTAQKFGGTTRGASAADRQANARQNISNRPQTSDRSRQGGTSGDRGGGNRAQASDRSGPGQSGNRPQAGTNDSNRGGDRGGDRGSAGGGNRGGASGGGGDRVGNRSVSNSSSRGNAMGGSSGGSARASSSRGSSSMGGGGRSRGGGGGGRRR